MSRFDNIASGKQLFINAILQDDDLCKCLRHPSPDYLSRDVGNRGDLIYSNIFPTKYVPEVHEDAKSYICIGFNYEKSSTSSLYYTVSWVSFYMFCHKSLVRTDYGYTRPDFMLAKVDDFMLGAKGEPWIGRMEFDQGGDEILDQNGNYVGVYARYRSVLLNDYR